MTWFVVDDGFWGHPKVTDLSGEAIALWTQAGSWCCRYLTDGVMPLDIARRLGRKPRAVRELLNAKLWEIDQETIRFHDWSDYQDTRESIVERRRQAAERKQKSRMSRVPNSDVTASVTRESRVAPVLSSPLPSSPLQERETSLPSVEKVAPKVASPRGHDKALLALKAALKAAYDVPPALTTGNAKTVAGRLRSAVEAGKASDLTTAASDLVRAAKASQKAFPWALFDADPYGTTKPAPIARMGRIAPAPGTTGADFEDCEDFEAQMRRQGVSV